jgi:hypothetical protein
MKSKLIAFGALFCAWLMTAYVYPIHAVETETSKTATLGIEGMT